MSGAAPESVTRLDIPPTGSACGVGCFLVFVGFFVTLAVSHLARYSETHTVGIVCAVLWLLLVAICLVGGVQAAGGLRGSAVAALGVLSSRHFAEAAREGDRVVIGFGFELFRHRFYYLRVERERIVSVDMSTGQATSLAGHDMNDWSVALWYREPDRDPPRVHVEGVRDDEVYIVGPPGPKEVTGQFLATFVAFLRAAGVDLHPGPKEYEFRTADPNTQLGGV
jgi:hypothetical protein